MKPSRTPKTASKPEQSKYIKMRQKLQLKANGEETAVPQEAGVLEDVPIATMHEVPPAGEDEEHPAADLGNAQQGKLMPKKRNQSNHFNQASPMKIVRLCKGMTPGQRELIEQSELGDIIQMKCSKLIPELCLFLMASFDPVNCILDFGERGRIPVNAESVVKVLGVPMGSSVVPYLLDVDATNLMMQMFGIQNGTLLLHLWKSS